MISLDIFSDKPVTALHLSSSSEERPLSHVAGGVDLQEVDPISIIPFNDILSGWNSTIGAILAEERPQRIHDLDIFDFIRSKHFSN